MDLERYYVLSKKDLIRVTREDIILEKVAECKR